MGVRSDYLLTQEEFDSIYSKVPRLTVEVILKTDEGVLLTKRTIKPCIGMWHLPGGTVRYGESLEEAVKRVANKELGINVITSEQIGIIEYPDHVASGYGDPKGIAFLVTKFEGDIKTDEEADEYGWFSELTEKIHPHQDEFLVSKNLIIDSKITKTL